MAKRRDFNVFSLSFLDIMSCGFGAVILIYIVIQHSTETTTQELSIELMAEVTRLEEEVEEGTERLVQLRNTLNQTDDEIVTTEGMARDVIAEILELQSEIEALRDSGASSTEEIEALKQELKELQRETASLDGSVGGVEQSGTSLRSFVGDGDRQYLTGINMGGERILILLDSSASMLHETIVNAIRMNNMSDAAKLESEKWQRAVRTVEWIVANLPQDAEFQIYSFSTEAKSLVPDAETAWLSAINREDTDKAVENLKALVPGGGTSLHHPFAVAANLDPKPDNVFLIVDSLPTQDFDPPRGSNIKSRDRVKLFTSSLDELPDDVPVNVILFPMEGDPLATPYFWILAQASGGSFLTPSRDWP